MGISLRVALLSTAFLDELTTGVLVVGLPLVRDRLHLDYAQVGLLFTVGALASLLVDPLINLLSDRRSKRRLVTAGMLGLVLGFILAGAAPSYAWLLLAVALIWPAMGAAEGVAQAALIDLDPGVSLRTMVRWTLFGSAGDILAPAAIGLLVGAGFHWPALCMAAAACWLLLLTVVAPRPFPMSAAHPKGGDGARAGVLAALRVGVTDWMLLLGVTDWMLLRWVGVELGATMLDEVFIGFAALYLRDRLAATPGEVGFVLLPGALAALLSLAALERVLRRVRGVQLLPFLALVALVGVVTLLTAKNLWVAGTGLVAINAGAAGWYPIARAAAYDRYSGRPGLVRTILGITAPLELILPAVVGLVAARFGIRAGVLLLGLAPLGVLLLAPHQRTWHREPTP